MKGLSEKQGYTFLLVLIKCFVWKSLLAEMIAIFPTKCHLDVEKQKAGAKV